MEIRQAFPNEVVAVMAVLSSAKQFLAESGSSQQQGENGYPNEGDVFDDILQGQAYVAVVGGQIVAYAAVIDGKDEAYDKIYDGKWQHNNYRYITIHRLAVLRDFAGQGIAQTFLQGLIEGQAGSDFRIDTHEKNKAMRHIVEKLGFVYCGKVPIDGQRLAYQKIKQNNENALYQEIDEADYHGF